MIEVDEEDESVTSFLYILEEPSPRENANFYSVGRWGKRQNYTKAFLFYLFYFMVRKDNFIIFSRLVMHVKHIFF